MRLHWLVIGITLIVTFSTFGYPLLFDRLFIGLLAVTALVSFKWDKNLFALCLISIASLLIEEAAWSLSSGKGELPFVTAAYLYLILACYICRYSRTGRLSSVAAAVAIVAECYWLVIGKDGPDIYWYIFICAHSLVIKHLVLLRPHYCSLKLPECDKDWKITKTDIDLGYLLSARIIVEFFNISEYLMRHILNYASMIIYDHYNLLAHALFALTFYIYLRSFAETLRSKVFSA